MPHVNEGVVNILFRRTYKKRRRETPRQVLEAGVTQIRGAWITPNQVKHAAERVLHKLTSTYSELLLMRNRK